MSSLTVGVSEVPLISARRTQCLQQDTGEPYHHAWPGPGPLLRRLRLLLLRTLILLLLLLPLLPPMLPLVPLLPLPLLPSTHDQHTQTLRRAKG